MGLLSGGWRLYLILGTGIAVVAVWLQIAALRTTVREQAALIAAQSADLDRAVAANAAAVAAAERQARALAKADASAAAARDRTVAMRRRLDAIADAVLATAGEDPAAGPRVTRALDEIRRAGGATAAPRP